MAAHPGLAYEDIPEVDQLLRFQAHVWDGLQHRSPDPAITRVAVVLSYQIGWTHSAVGQGQAHSRVEHREEDLEVPAVYSGGALTREPRE
jgi:hypothetical protein